ncbi:MAG: nuclear transport factor 2 family protein [Chitinophagales bacterium]
MAQSPMQVFEAFRASMMAKSEDWMDLLAENVSLIGPLAQVEGKSLFIEVNKPFFSSITDSTLYKLVETEDYIITQISTTIAVPSGETLTLEVSEWYEIREGLLQSLRVYFDTAEFLKAVTG